MAIIPGEWIVTIDERKWSDDTVLAGQFDTLRDASKLFNELELKHPNCKISIYQLFTDSTCR